MTHQRLGDRRHDFHRVEIVEVNLDTPHFPVALGVGTQGGQFEIDLRLSAGSVFVIPSRGEHWYVWRRTGRWALAHREHDTKVKGKGEGDKVDDIGLGVHFINGKAIKVAKSDGTTQEKSYEQGYTGTVQLAGPMSGSNDVHSHTTISLRFKNGLLVAVTP